MKFKKSHISLLLSRLIDEVQPKKSMQSGFFFTLNLKTIVKQAIFRNHPAVFSVCSVKPKRKEIVMPDSVYKIIELVGSSHESWEKAAATAIAKASETLRELRVAEVSAMDVTIKDGKIESYRTKLKVSFKFEGHH